MKRWFAKASLALGVIIGSAGIAGNAAAEYTGPALGAPWTSSITYMNIGDADANEITVYLYPGNGASAVTYNPDTLKMGAGTSLGIGAVEGISEGFQGGAIMQSNSKLAATPVFYAFQDGAAGLSGRDVRPLSNGFDSSQASSTFLIPTVLNQPSSNTAVASQIAIQNTESSDITVTIKYYAVGETEVAKEDTQDLGAGESWIIDASTAGLGDDFSGSAVVTAVIKGTDTEGKVVASATEYQKVGSAAYSFEGVPQGANKVYMPSALCAQGGGVVNTDPETFFAVQNASFTENAVVKITYYDKDGAVAATVEDQTIPPGGKSSFRGCGKDGSYNGMTPGTVGSAIIESTGGEIVAIGKVSFANLNTAFVGEATGSNKLALPYIRWATEANLLAGARQRAYVAVQNVGTTAETVTAKYYDRDGTEVGSQELTIEPGLKANTNPSSANAYTDPDNQVFGYYNPGSGGAIIIEGDGDAQLIATVRIVTGDPAGTNRTGEDFSGVQVQ